MAYANDKKPPAAAGGLRPSGPSRVILGAEIIPLPPEKASAPGASRGLVAAGIDMPAAGFAMACGTPRRIVEAGWAGTLATGLGKAGVSHGE